MAQIEKRNPPSETGGVVPMNIAGRMVSERERLLGMSDAERAWRAQWIKDQVLAPDEPKVPENWYKERYNPIRRFYRAPMERFEKALTGPLGSFKAKAIRHIIAKTALGIYGIYNVVYYLKYNGNNWARKTVGKYSFTRKKTVPGDVGYPNYKKMAPDDYASYGFKNSPI